MSVTMHVTPNGPKLIPWDSLDLLYPSPIATWFEYDQNGLNIYFKFSCQNPSRPNSSQIDTRCSLGCPDEKFNSFSVQWPSKMVKLESGGLIGVLLLSLSSCLHSFLKINLLLSRSLFFCMCEF